MNFTFFVMLVALVLAGYLVIQFITSYRVIVGTPWERMVKSADDSATKLWAKFVMFLGAGVALLANSADYFNDPALANGIRAVLQPSYVAYFTVAVAFITILARNRTK